MSKELVNATQKELAGWPGVTMTEEDGGKHKRIVLHFGGESRMVVASSTPSDARAVPNHIATVRRELRALGAAKEHVVVGRAKAKPAPKPATNKPFENLEVQMGRQDKIAEIFKGIEALRYAEMLALAEHFSTIAGAVNMRRGDPRSWAMMLQAAVDEYNGPAPAGNAP